jgi:hypothetical protein
MKAYVLVMLSAALFIGGANNFASDPVRAQTGTSQVLNQTDWSELGPILPKFFDGLVAKRGGKEALSIIKERFPIDSSATDLLAFKIDDLLRTFGAIEGYELVGVRTLPGSKRLYQIAYLTINSVAPVLWEATAYRRKEGWILLKLSFNTEEIFDKAKEYK